MALLPFEELIKVDVRPFCETRKAKDDNGNVVDIPYLNWAKCVKLLHENGAKDVWAECYLCGKALVEAAGRRETVAHADGERYQRRPHSQAAF